MLGEDVDVPALGPQRPQVGAGRLGAGEDDEVGRGDRPAGRDELEADAGLEPERIEVVEIGDARQARHDDAERARAAPARGLEREHVLGREAVRIGKERHRAEAGDAGAARR